MTFDALLRFVYAKIAASSPAPRQYLVDMIETIIGSMDAVRPCPTEGSDGFIDRVIAERTAAELREFLENVLQRFPKPTDGSLA